jgi:hypothetical protein
MATSPIFPRISTVRPFDQPRAEEPQSSAGPGVAPVVRTPLHAVATGVGMRTARRRITPEAGFALEALGHAIEYLADEYAHAAGSLPSLHSTDPRVTAIQLLMAANREVYYSCPVVPSFIERVMRRVFGKR